MIDHANVIIHTNIVQVQFSKILNANALHYVWYYEGGILSRK